MQVIGKIESIDTRSVKTRFGNKPVYDIKINGEVYQNGFQKPTFNVGDMVQADYNAGKYGNDIVKGSLQAAPTGASPTPAAAPASDAGGAPKNKNGATFPLQPLHPDRIIVRQNSLTQARGVWEKLFDQNVKGRGDEVLTEKDAEEAVELIIKLARGFEAYSAGDDDAEAVKKEVEGD